MFDNFEIVFRMYHITKNGGGEGGGGGLVFKFMD